MDASLIEADVDRQNSSAQVDWDTSAIDPEDAPRAVREYLDVLDDKAFGAATAVKPKFTSHSDPASQWTAARKGPAIFSYSNNYLIDTDHSVIADEGTRSIRQAEVGSVRTMLDRIKAQHDIDPERLIADSAYGSGPMLGWLVDRDIKPHIPVLDSPHLPMTRIFCESVPHGFEGVSPLIVRLSFSRMRAKVIVDVLVGRRM